MTVDQLDSDLAAVRQLLLSTATYAESANRRIDHVGKRLEQEWHEMKGDRQPFSRQVW